MGGPINGLKQFVSIPSVVGSVLLGAVLTHLGGRYKSTGLADIGGSANTSESL